MYSILYTRYVFLFIVVFLTFQLNSKEFLHSTRFLTICGRHRLPPNKYDARYHVRTSCR